MAQILRIISSCFDRPSYSLLHKKDENLGIEQAEKWVQKYPINREEIKRWGYEKIQAYVKNLFSDLKLFPITPGNKELIRDHLVEACKSDPSMNLYISNHFNTHELKGCPSEVNEIEHTLILTHAR